MLLDSIFWLSVLLILHSYLLYPALLALLSRNRKNNATVYSKEEEFPRVAVLVSAYNEEAVIGEKIDSIFRGSYPPGKLEVRIGSDCSNDRTNEILRECAATYPQLKIFLYHERRGKQNVINDLVSGTDAEILVLTDANVIFDQHTLRNMVRHFKNPCIGLVDTNMINRGMKKEGISIQESTYISREVHIKNMEGRLWGAMMGPFGGCYAIRKEDYSRVPANYLVDDFYINMHVFTKGKKAINDLEAKVYEDVSNAIRDEFRRKVRIATGNFQNLKTFAPLLFRPYVGFCFFSHKVLRWLGPFFILAALTANIFLAFASVFYLVLLGLHVLLFLMPLLDVLLKSMGIHHRFLRLATHFYAMNLALLIGFFKFLRPVRSGVWDRTRRNQ
ncbi:MAG: glycosyltransferase [Bacteroidales bacterium]